MGGYRLASWLAAWLSGWLAGQPDTLGLAMEPNSRLAFQWLGRVRQWLALMDTATRNSPLQSQAPCSDATARH